MKLQTSASSHTVCPQCSASIPVHQGYVSWCSSCDWNVNPVEEEFLSMVDRINRKFGQRYSRQILQSALNKSLSLQPSFGLSRFLAFTLSAIVHLSTLFLAAGGILLLYFGWFNIMYLVYGIFCLVMAVATRPRLSSPPENVLQRDEYPNVYESIMQLANSMGLKKIEGIVIDDQYNASFQRAGIRGRVYITLGLPLYSILTDEERIALLAHEIGHGVNGDPQRGMFVHTAVDTLQKWYDALMPESLFSSEGGLPGIFMLPVNAVMLVLAKLVEVYSHLLLFLLFRESQRSEYLADLFATKAAGSNAVITLLEKLNLEQAYHIATQRTALNKGKNLLKELAQEIREIPEHEQERLRRQSLITSSAVDATHPPTVYRMDFIKQHGFEVHQPALSRTQSREIWTELMTLRDTVQRAAVDRYRSYLYA